MDKRTKKQTTRPARRRRKVAGSTAYGRDTTYSRHIHKLSKCICPDLSISVPAMNIMNSFVKDLLERIADEASKLVHHSHKTTMGMDDIISATKLVVTTPELCKYATQLAKNMVEWTENSNDE